MLTIYNAISVDGYIATLDDDSDWTRDDFEAILKNYECVIYGRRTYDDMLEYGSFPYKDIKNIVYTKTPEKYKNVKGAEFTNESPADLIKGLEKEGIKKILLAGGGKTNFSFLSAGVVDEVIITVHPIILGKGISLFDGNEIKVELEKVEVKELENGLTTIRLKVVK